MQKAAYILSLIFILALSGTTAAQDKLKFKGQLSAWTLYNGGLDLPVYLGGMYIPQLNYNLNLKNDRLIDFEASATLRGSFGFNPFDTIYPDGQIKPYRLWGRYSSQQLELRVGLQKINFGSASMIRPLMWFDELDPRDPLKMTNGVWGVLGRYYFLNNANIWLWVLYGNDDPKGWELFGTHESYPEMGGRFQSPIPAGEAALSYHYRIADTRTLGGLVPVHEKVQQNRIGLDFKLDLTVGLWFEGSWINNNEDLGIFTNQELLNVGVDYTFGLGSGLYLIFEQLLIANDEKAFHFQNTSNFSLLSLSYPLGIFDNISGILYYDWTNNSLYNFINWEHQFEHIVMYLMAYWNPDDYRIPLQDGAQNLYAGRGVQIMFVFNH